MTRKFNVKTLIIAALCVTLGLLFPTVFHMFGATGPIFLPMHIPVLLCGFLCGARYGGLCGLIVPLLSSLLTGMPTIYPTGIAMMLELATYGFVSGFLYERALVRGRANLYVSLVGAMLAGRLVSGVANAILLFSAGKAYTFATFIAAAFVTALPGIIIQIVFVPLLVVALEKAGVTRPVAR